MIKIKCKNVNVKNFKNTKLGSLKRPIKLTNLHQYKLKERTRVRKGSGS